MRKFASFFLVIVLAAGVRAQNFWESANSPRGAAINYLGVSSSGSIFAASSVLYTSSDDGSNWTTVASNKSFLGAMLILSDGTMLDGVPYDGMYKSTDQGVTWTITNSDISNQTYTSIARAASGELYAGSSGSGVFKSTDNGNNWAAKQTGLASLYIRGVAVHPISGNIYVTTGSGVSRSTDAGGKWTTMSVTAAQHYSIAIDSAGNVYTARFGGIEVSTDDGATWSNSISGLTDTTVQCLVALPNVQVFAGTQSGVFRSTDHGATWSPVGNGLSGINVTGLAVRQGNELVAGTSAGVFTSADNGDHWTRRVSGMNRLGAGDPVLLDGGRVMEGLGIAGTYTTDNNGTSWEQRTGTTPPLRVVSSIRLSANTFLAGSYYSGVWKTTDNGDSWTRVGLNGNVVAALKRSGGMIFAATSSGVFSTSDDGTTWDSTGLKNQYLNDMVIDTTGAVLVGGNLGLWRSTDNGATWDHLISDTTAGGSPTLIIVSGLARDLNGSLYNITGYAQVQTKKGIHKSTDNGITWTHLDTPDSTVYVLAVNAAGEIFAGLRRGVMRSRDGGATWSMVAAGLDSATEVDYIEFAAGGTAYAGTSTGVYESVQSTTAVRENGGNHPGAFSLRQNYPNPFNPSTKIGFEIATPGNVSLKIYGVLGQKIATLVDERLTAGAYSVVWNATNVPSGIYFCRLSSGNDLGIQKIVLMK